MNSTRELKIPSWPWPQCQDPACSCSCCPARCSAPDLPHALQEHPVPCGMPRTHPLRPIMARSGTRGRGQEVFLLEYLVWACIPSFTIAKLQPCVFASSFCINTEGIFFLFFWLNLTFIGLSRKLASFHLIGNVDHEMSSKGFSR